MIAFRTVALVLAFALTALVLLPLRFAWAAATPSTGIEVSAITGTVWSGKLHDVSWRGIALGDMEISSSILERPGDLILHLRSKGQLTSARLATSFNGFALEDVSGNIRLSSIFSQAPPEAMLRITKGGLTLDGESCRTATGRVTTDAIKSFGVPSLEGTVACEKGQLTLSLVSSNKSQSLKIAVDITTSAPKAIVVEADQATTIWLATMGISLAERAR